MFTMNQYIARRQNLRQQFSSGLLLILGNSDASINFSHNNYWFRQDSSFSYLFGLNSPDVVGIIDIDAGIDILFGDAANVDAVIWAGPQPSLVALAGEVGVTTVMPMHALADILESAQKAHRTIHYLPPYRGDSILTLSRLLRCTPEQVSINTSAALIAAIIHLREIKEEHEIAEIEYALSITKKMHVAAMQATKPGKFEYEVVGMIEGIMRSHDLHGAYPVIFTRHGEILHSRQHTQQLVAGDLVVNDSGVSSALGYASDITRTIPVGGKFSARQRPLYNLVLAAQERAIAAIKPAVTYLAIHKLAALVIVEGMMEMGFFNGDPQQVVDSGAYAICFPHGVGHQLGLDVHDMEGLGETAVGYDDSVTRSDLFGMRNLRLAKPLRAGMVLTVEPGIYFIPTLIKRWKDDGLHAAMINYDRFGEYLDFGGIRIEDNVLVTTTGARVLGPAIPKTCEAVEAAMAS
ncbi:aminopeptidase P family protein [Glaciimonas immobilis]|uniref:Xaa-Pro aminopeptidase n=1 Tax=Glaciimonas immobilis TaxID=728004 RepID=A0A840RPG2_9BURK|nr:aminopeptidase P family protein [Glaciimonas immobilis]KAF3999166.1 aminopeptidase P family protein [Glaciimonas immobilis]MBB5198614.1 Xaa-Pro aminopeptidase/Xaa-Pro dipeptidase [Glaciimonas immobilis]